jgi:hypothetical protein
MRKYRERVKERSQYISIYTYIYTYIVYNQFDIYSRLSSDFRFRWSCFIMGALTKLLSLLKVDILGSMAINFSLPYQAG